MDSLQPQKKCSAVVKTLFTLSLLLNMLFIGALGYAYITFKPLIDVFTHTQVVNEEDGDSMTIPTQGGTTNNATITPDQAAMLESAGIDPNAVPNTITPELENCLRSAVGADRAAAIEAGAQPTPTEIMKAAQCL